MIGSDRSIRNLFMSCWSMLALTRVLFLGTTLFSSLLNLDLGLVRIFSNTHLLMRVFGFLILLSFLKSSSILLKMTDVSNLIFPYMSVRQLESR